MSLIKMRIDRVFEQMIDIEDLEIHETVGITDRVI